MGLWKRPGVRILLLAALAVAGVEPGLACFRPTEGEESPPGPGNSGNPTDDNGGDGSVDGGIACQVAPEVFYTAEPQLVALTTADLNGDGRFEVLAAGGNLLRVWHPSLDAGLSSTETYSTLGNTVSLAVGRFDDDAFLDVSVVNSDPQSTTQVFPGLSNALFSTPRSGPGRAFIKQSVAADFDGDGRMDWAIAADNLLNGEVYVLLDTIAATPFTSNYQLDATRRRAGIAAADWTQDGRVDLAASDAVNGIVTLYAGIGDGGFTFLANIDAGIAPRALGAADINGDGYPDLVAAAPDDLSLAFMTGTDAGSLSPYVRVPSNGGHPVAVVAGGNTSHSLQGVLAAENNPDALGSYVMDGGILQAAGTLATHSAPRAVALAEIFDGDGDLDVVALLDGGVSVYRVICP